MARIVVVGAGFAGLSAAARFAKLRHEVVVLESSDRIGGRLNHIEIDGTAFALATETVTLPGVLRDLFRKSGRPLERAADMTIAGPRRHVFKDGEVLDLPFGDRASQHDAVVAGLGEDLWSEWVDGWPDAWEALRRTWLDQVTRGTDDLDRPLRRTLDMRRSMERLAKKGALKQDPALAKIVLDPLRIEGQDRRLTPAFTAVRHYVERNFGRWEFEGGLPTLAAALEVRLKERKVAVELNHAVQELQIDGDINRGGRVTGVVTDAGSVGADLVVWCAPTWPAPLREPGLTPAIPASRTFVTLDPEIDLPDDVFVHSNPPIRMWHAGGGRWTLTHLAGERPLEAMARAGLDIRGSVTGEPVTYSPSDLVRLGHWGWQWFNGSSVDSFPGIAPRDDLVFAGAHAWPSGVLGGGTIEEIGMTTAALADRLGPAPR